MEPATEILLANPYTAHQPVSTIDLQLLLLVGVACLVVGLLLAEQTTLRKMLAASDETMRELVRRPRTEPVNS